MVFLAKLAPTYQVNAINLPALTALVTATSFGTSSCLCIAQADEHPSLLEHTRAPSHRNEGFATTFSSERVTRSAIDAVWGTTFRVLTLFKNQLAAVFIDACRNNAHQQNLNRVEFHT